MRVESMREVTLPVPVQRADDKKEAGDFTNVLDALLALLAQPLQQPAMLLPSQSTDSGDESSLAQLTIEQAMLSLLLVNGDEEEQQARVQSSHVASDSDIHVELPVEVPPNMQLPVNEPVTVSQSSLHISQTTLVPQVTDVDTTAVSQPPAPLTISDAIEKSDLQVPDNKALRQEAPRIAMEQGQPQRTQEPRGVDPQVTALPRPVEPVARPIASETLSALRTEIVSFSTNPTRPAIILEVNPPEYGRVLVSAEQEAGRVMIRLVVDNLLAKEHLLAQLPKVQSAAEIAVVTTEEYREKQQASGGRENPRQGNQQQTRENKKDQRVEFVV